jgi:murein L,D-transpeptidase YcbB/YkuD
MYESKFDDAVCECTVAGILQRPFFIFAWLFLTFLVFFPVFSPAFAANDSSEYGRTSAQALVAGGQVALLDEVIERYELIDTAGGWPLPGEGPPLAESMRHEDVRILRKRLRLSGDYTAEMGADPLYFDGHIAAALKSYQRNHGMPVSGVLGRLTRRELNIDVKQRINELRQARVAWTAYDGLSGSPRLWINIPEATVAALRNNKIELQMRAVVGHPSRPTPVLSSAVKSVVVNPTWTVPRSIALQDLIPKQVMDENYLHDRHIRVFKGRGDDALEVAPEKIDWRSMKRGNFPYYLRQDPGPFNSLGKLKFVFPNKYDVYLHDTPTRALLGLSYRTISSGCVRVENPKILASWVVGEGSEQSLNRFLEAEDYTPRSVRVANDVPIELIYITAWVSPEDGVIQFRQDIYGLLDQAEQFATQ